jgi:SecD/SecF fusion protein
MRKRIFLVVLLLIGLGIISWGGRWLYFWVTRPTMERNGGTILVYEVDVDKFPDGKTPASFNADDLGQAIKRRLDPTADNNISVTPVDDQRVEIVIPHRSDRPDHVQHCKDLLSQIGSLEFRIVANQTDDAEAMAAAQEFFKHAGVTGSGEQRLVALATQNHKPPPPPFSEDGGTFSIKLNGDNYKHTYSWVELGRSERKTLNLDDPQPGSDDLLKQVLENLNDGNPLVTIGAMQALLYTRKVENVDALPEKHRGRQYEYFLLTRDPEPNKAITGQYLANVQATQSRGKPAVGFHFNQQGGSLLSELTTRNSPENVLRRHLAIELDGLIQAAPSLNGVISTDGVIEGKFTQAEVDRLVQILRAGQLPATLKQVPVSEVQVKPVSAK